MRQRTWLEWVRPRHVDAVIAATGSAVGILTIALGEQATGVPLFAGPMLSAAIIFFYGNKPPPPKAFLWGTAACSTLGLAITTACTQYGLPAFVSTSMSVGALFLVYRFGGFAYPPLASFPGMLAGAAAGPGATSSLLAALRFLLFPWLAGHAVLYSVAMATAVARRLARNRLAKAIFTTLATLSDESLRETFDRFDTNGNGNIDSLELQVALRSTGYTISLQEAEALIQGVDIDGNGEVDFEEFKAVCRQAM